MRELAWGEFDGRDDEGVTFPSAGVFAVDASREGFWKAGDFDARAREVISHEAVHQYLALSCGVVPEWASEGLAYELGSRTDLVAPPSPDGAIRIRGCRGRAYLAKWAARAIAGGTTLESFFARKDADFMAREGETAYALNGAAWSFVHFLLASDERRWLVTRYFAKLHVGRSPEQAFAATFGRVDREELDREWRSFVAHL